MQRRVLVLAAAGKVWRASGPQRSIVWRAQDARAPRTVNATLRALESAGLIDIVGAPGLFAHPIVTDAGRALPATPNPEPEGH